MSNKNTSDLNDWNISEMKSAQEMLYEHATNAENWNLTDLADITEGLSTSPNLKKQPKDAGDLHTQKHSNMPELERDKLHAEIIKLMTEIVKLYNEPTKLAKGIRWRDVAIGAAATLAIITITKLLLI